MSAPQETVRKLKVYGQRGDEPEMMREVTTSQLLLAWQRYALAIMLSSRSFPVQHGDLRVWVER